MKRLNEYEKSKIKLNRNVMTSLLNSRGISQSQLYFDIIKTLEKDPSEREIQDMLNEERNYFNGYINGIRNIPFAIIPGLEKSLGVDLSFLVNGSSNGNHITRGIEYAAYSHDLTLTNELAINGFLFNQDEFEHGFVDYCLDYNFIDGLDFLLSYKDENRNYPKLLDYGWTYCYTQIFTYDNAVERLFDFIIANDKATTFFKLFDLNDYIRSNVFSKDSFLEDETHLAKILNSENIFNAIITDYSSIQIDFNHRGKETSIKTINPWIYYLLQYGLSHFEPDISPKLIKLLNLSIKINDEIIKQVEKEIANTEVLTRFIQPSYKLEKNKLFDNQGYFYSYFITIEELNEAIENGTIIDLERKLIQQTKLLNDLFNQRWDISGNSYNSEENTNNPIENEFFEKAKELSYIPKITSKDNDKLYFNPVKGHIITDNSILSEELCVDLAKKLKEIYNLSTDKEAHYVHTFLKLSNLVYEGSAITRINGWNHMKYGNGYEDLLDLCWISLNDIFINKRIDAPFKKMKSIVNAFNLDEEMKHSWIDMIIQRIDEYLKTIDLESEKGKQEYSDVRRKQTFFLIHRTQFNKVILE